ncbi:hypothetical protein IE53DRAFT_187569 [Violaceomyces palustris]|uniref:Uncharacterized protein n=1 Tax=Violaceomyces palustris TaxID=1673888 RepID=A0ACD0NS65_9BASI|nr:hypothetical protein IE53DRAFT_187569 [Violaceomyces palustris]
MADRLPHLRGDSSFQKVSPKTGNKVIDIVKVTKHLGEEWKTLGASDRAKFDKVAEEEKAVYEKQMAAWQASLTPEDIRRQNAYISSQRKKGHKGHAMLRDPTKPKKPLTAFFEYLSDARSKDQDYQAGTISIRDFAKKCGETWKAMTKEEKDKYEQRAIGAFDQYKRDIEEWKKGQATA